MATGGNLKAIIAAMLANAGIATAKFIAFLATGSASMLAESIHSVADTSNQGLLILGGRRAKKVEDDDHQFGYGRERYFWAFIVAMVLFALGGVFSVFEGIEKIRHPHELESLGWAIGVLVFGIVIEGFSFRIAIIESRKVKGQRTWWQFIRSSRSPELPVVLLEDAGAEIGMVLALIGVSLAQLTGNPVWDGVGTLAIGILLLVIAITLTIEMQSLLIGEAATDANVRKITELVKESPHIQRVIELKTQHIGPEELLVAAMIEFDPEMSSLEISTAIDQLEKALRESVPLSMRIYIEPAVKEAENRSS